MFIVPISSLNAQLREERNLSGRRKLEEERVAPPGLGCQEVLGAIKIPSRWDCRKQRIRHD